MGFPALLRMQEGTGNGNDRTSTCNLSSMRCVKVFSHAFESRVTGCKDICLFGFPRTVSDLLLRCTRLTVASSRDRNTKYV